MEKSGEEGIPDLAYVMRTLSAENISNLPPGGGLASKYEHSLSALSFLFDLLSPGGPRLQMSTCDDSNF